MKPKLIEAQAKVLDQMVHGCVIQHWPAVGRLAQYTEITVLGSRGKQVDACVFESLDNKRYIRRHPQSSGRYGQIWMHTPAGVAALAKHEKGGK